MSTVFISHSSNDRAVVEHAIVKPLNEHDVETWYSKSEIRTSADWQESIAKGLNACDWFLVAVSPAATASEWVRSEVFWALRERRDRFISVLLAPCDVAQVDLRLPRIQHIDIADSSKILAAIGIVDPRETTPQRAPLLAWEVARPTLTLEDRHYLMELLLLAEDVKRIHLPCPSPYQYDMLERDGTLKEVEAEIDQLGAGVAQLSDLIASAANREAPIADLGTRANNLVYSMDSLLRRSAYDSLRSDLKRAVDALTNTEAVRKQMRLGRL